MRHVLGSMPHPWTCTGGTHAMGAVWSFSPHATALAHPLLGPLLLAWARHRCCCLGMVMGHRGRATWSHRRLKRRRGWVRLPPGTAWPICCAWPTPASRGQDRRPTAMHFLCIHEVEEHVCVTDVWAQGQSQLCSKFADFSLYFKIHILSLVVASISIEVATSYVSNSW
jgi:hypothetical protein